MMNPIWKVSLFSLLLCPYFGLMAQNQTEAAPTLRAKWGQIYKEPANSNLSKIIATDGDGFYALRMHREGMLGSGTIKPIVEYYDKNMCSSAREALIWNTKAKTAISKMSSCLGDNCTF